MRTVNLLGHPVHQMLIVFPLGLLVTAVIFDIIYLSTGVAAWSLVSFYLIAAGILGGLLAAVFGLADWWRIPADTRAKRVGAMHGIGNVIVVLLFAGSLWLRDQQTTAPTWAYILSFVGGGIGLITAWLGGELVNRLGVGVDAGANMNAPNSLSATLPIGQPREDFMTEEERRKRAS